MEQKRVISVLRPAALLLLVVLFGLPQVGSVAERAGLEETRSLGFNEATSGSVSIGRPSVVQGNLLPEPPQLSPEERQRLEQAINRTHLPGPQPSPSKDAAAKLDAVGPSVPATGEAASPAKRAMDAAPLTPGTFTLFQNVDLGAGAPSGYTSVVGEPSVGNNGTAVFQTGNWYAALSTDNGATFSFVNPFTTFPSVNGGFCCDQSVLYNQSRDLLFWLMLYRHDTNTNTLRLAIAKGQSALSSGTWYYYDLTPQMVGLPTGRWFDYPHLALSNNYLYVTANVFTISTPYTWTNTVIMRLPLDTLSAHTALTLDYYVTNDHFNFTATQGATTRIYWGSQSLTSWQIRLYQWDEGSPTVSWTDVAISSYPLSTPSCPGPDGRDWCGRSDDRILGAWVANGIIGFMWNASQGSGYPYPHIRALRITESTKAVIDQPVLWNSNFAWIYPAVGVNARGHIAGPVFSGGGTSYPTLNVFIWDDLSPDPMTSGWETHGVVTSTNGPIENKWGDYLASRPQSPNSNTWIGTGYSLQGGGANSNARPRFIWFGRERDTPSPPSQQFALTVRVRGSAGGTVTSNPGGINCSTGSTCIANYASVPPVTLTEDTGSGASFKQWGGACSGTATTCTVTMNASQSVTATVSQVFTDPTLTARSTPIKAVHVTELRSAINTLRAVNSLSAFSWTDSTLTVGSTPAKKVHMDELRQALNEAGGPSPSSYETLVVGQTTIKASHISDLRNAVRALE